MIGKLLCWLGLHDLPKRVIYMGRNAGIGLCIVLRECRRCHQLIEWH